MKWEYLITDVRRYVPEITEMSDGYYSGLDDQELNRLGSDGWEMVEARKNGEQAVFKRMLSEPVATPYREPEPPAAASAPPAPASTPPSCDHRYEAGKRCDKPVTHRCVCRRCAQDDAFHACDEHTGAAGVIRYHHQRTYPAHEMALQRIGR